MNTLSPHAQALPSRSADPKRKHGIRFMNLMDGKMKRKSKCKWYAIWTVYCILISPLLIMAMFSYFLKLPFELLVERVGKVKWWLVNRYKPD
jgi:hypothetical protein